MIEYFEKLADLLMDISTNDLHSIHSACLITFLRTKCYDGYLRRIAESLPYKLRMKILDPFFDGVKLASKIVNELKPRVELSDVENVLNLIKRRLETVGAVFVVDCFSPVEFLAYLIKLRIDGFESELLDVYFTNIGEVTRYLTSQAGGSIRGFSEYLASSLNAKVHDKYSYFDKLVHQSILLEDFLREIPHRDIYSRVLKYLQTHKSILVTSDHGYDVVMSNGLMYVTHPSPKEGSVLKFSSVAMFLIGWR